MRWPWQRRAEDPADDEAATAPAPERPRRPAGEWRDLPALQSVSLADASTAAEPLRFVHTLATRWQVPPALEQLGHRQDVAAPSGAALVAPAAPQVGYADAPVPVWPAVPDPAPATAPDELPPARRIPPPAAATEHPAPGVADDAVAPGRVPTSSPVAVEVVRPLVGRTSLLTVDPADLREAAPAAAADAGPGEPVPPASHAATPLLTPPPADRPAAPRPPVDAPTAPARPTTSGVPDWFRSGAVVPAEPPAQPAAPEVRVARATAPPEPAATAPTPEPVTPQPAARPRRVPWPRATVPDAGPSDEPADDADHDEPADEPADEPGHESDPETRQPAAEPAQPLVDLPLADLPHPTARDAGAPPHLAESSGIRREETVSEAGARTIRAQQGDLSEPPTAKPPTAEPPTAELSTAELPTPELPAPEVVSPELSGSELPGSELPASELRRREPAGVEPLSSEAAATRSATVAGDMPVRRVLRVGAPLPAPDRRSDAAPTTHADPTDRAGRPGAVQGLAAFVAAASVAVPDDVLPPVRPVDLRAADPEHDGMHAELAPPDDADAPATRAPGTSHRLEQVEDAGAAGRPDVAAVLELLRPRDDDTQPPEPRQQDAAHAAEPDVPWWATPDDHGRAPRHLDRDDLDDRDDDDELDDASAAAVYDQVVRRLRHELLVERERAALLAD